MYLKNKKVLSFCSTFFPFVIKSIVSYSLFHTILNLTASIQALSVNEMTGLELQGNVTVEIWGIEEVVTMTLVYI